MSIENSTLYKLARERFIRVKSSSWTADRLVYQNYLQIDKSPRRENQKDSTCLWIVVHPTGWRENKLPGTEVSRLFDKKRIKSEIDLDICVKEDVDFCPLDPINYHPQEYFDECLSWAMRNRLYSVLNELSDKRSKNNDEYPNSQIDHLHAYVCALLDNPSDAILVLERRNSPGNTLTPFIVGLWAV